MIDAKKLFKSGKRYRGFAQIMGNYTPVTFSAYPMNTREIKLKYVFPSSLVKYMKKGNMIYALIEDVGYLIAELRISESKDRSAIAVLDFVSEDRRKLPRVKVKDILDVKADIFCGEKSYMGEVIDISMASLSIDVDENVPSGECEVLLIYRNLKTSIKGKVVRSAEKTVVFEVVDGSTDMMSFLGRIYSDLFLKIQRES